MIKNDKSKAPITVPMTGKVAEESPTVGADADAAADGDRVAAFGAGEGALSASLSAKAAIMMAAKTTRIVQEIFFMSMAASLWN